MVVRPRWRVVLFIGRHTNSSYFAMQEDLARHFAGLFQ
jgi:hypothetical protein